MKTRPNIVMFVPDSYRGDVLGHQGNMGALTPALDSLVARGAVSYSNAFAQNPVCTPSRCSFMTGWYPHVHGHRSMRNLLKPWEPTLMRALRENGYHAWWGGKNDLLKVAGPEDYLQYCDEKFSGAGQYDEFMNHFLPAALASDDPRRGACYGGVLTKGGQGRPFRDQDEVWVRGAVDFFRNRPENKPFFCYLPLGKPHPPYFAEEGYYNTIDPTKLPPRIPTPPAEANLPPVLDALRREYRASGINEETWLDVKRIYYAMCAKVDFLFGMVVEGLIEQGIYDDTLIVFMSDHGDFTGDYSLPEKTHSTLQDCLLRVPLIIKPPAGTPVQAGNRSHLAELVDVPATIYDLLEINPGYACQGLSLRSSIAGDETAIHDAVFAEVGSRRGETAFFNTEVNKMPPDSFYGMQSRAVRDFALAGTYAVTCRTLSHKYIRRYYTKHHELFDLEKDPGETLNLSGDPHYADIERAMETHLLNFFMDTGDVLPFTQDNRQ